MGLLDTLFAGGMQGNPEPDPQEAMLADLFRKLQASQHVQTQGVVNPGSTPAPDTGRVGMFSPSSAAASSAQLPPAVPPLQERPVQDAPQPGVPYAAPPPGMVPQDIAAKMPPAPSQATARPQQAAPPQREANVWDHLGRLSRGYNSGGLVGGVADMMNTGRDQADTNQTIAALGQQLGDPQMARMIMQDPELRKSVVPLLFKQKLGLTETPSNVREYQFYNKLSDAEKQAYLTMKRAQQYKDTGMEFVQPNAANPSAPPVSIIPKKPEEKAAATERGTQLAKAQIDLPKVKAGADMALKYIQDVIDDPNLSSVTGWQGSLPTVFPASRTTEAKINQLKGAAFLQAFESIKGGGAITETEGLKATQAKARLDDLRQDDAGYKKALEDFREEVKALVRLAEQKAAGGGAAPAAPAAPPQRLKYNPATGELE